MSVHSAVGQAQDQPGGLTWYPSDLPAIPFSRDFFESRRLDPDQCKLLLVTDRSMSPAVDPTDVVMVHTRASDLVVDDDVYAVLYRGELFLRRLRRRPQGGHKLIAENPAFEPFTVPAGDPDFQIVGRKVFRAG